MRSGSAAQYTGTVLMLLDRGLCYNPRVVLLFSSIQKVSVKFADDVILKQSIWKQRVK